MRLLFRLAATRWGFRLLLRLLTRTSYSGLAHIPHRGALIIVANHSSTIDPLLLIAASRRLDSYFVGPGDFRLTFPANLLVETPFVIRVRRSAQIEMTALKRMLDILKAGQCLALFPEGGTWEKPISDAKSGAAYLSMMTGAPILPIGLGGAYRVWFSVMRLRRPPLTVNVGEVMPPVAMPKQRAQREQVLNEATQTMMKRIYELLPAADQRRYDELARRLYHLKVFADGQPLEVWGAEVLGELMQKPNLLSPFDINARLPIQPFTKPGTYSGKVTAQAARALKTALDNSFRGYMEYRLGEEKSAQLRAALAALTRAERFATVVLSPDSEIRSEPESKSQA